MKPRIYLKDNFYHVVTRGNNQQNIFLRKQDFQRYLLKIEEYAEKYPVEIIAYALMKNHIHMLLKQQSDLPISKFMQALTIGYTMYFNLKYKRSGHLFQGRFHYTQVDNDEYLIHLSRYIHLNPVVAKVIDKAENYTWSSYKEYLGLRQTSWIKSEYILIHFRQSRLQEDYKGFAEAQIPEALERNLLKYILE
jgi:REP element-mobilizing transposase RayT